MNQFEYELETFKKKQTIFITYKDIIQFFINFILSSIFGTFFSLYSNVISLFKYIYNPYFIVKCISLSIGIFLNLSKIFLLTGKFIEKKIIKKIQLSTDEFVRIGHILIFASNYHYLVIIYYLFSFFQYDINIFFVNLISSFFFIFIGYIFNYKNLLSFLMFLFLEFINKNLRFFLLTYNFKKTYKESFFSAFLSLISVLINNLSIFFFLKTV